MAKTIEIPTETSGSKELDAVVHHPYVLKYKGNYMNRPGCAWLWAIGQKHVSLSPTELFRALTVAYDERFTPLDLRQKIMTYIISTSNQEGKHHAKRNQPNHPSPDRRCRRPRRISPSGCHA